MKRWQLSQEGFERLLSRLDAADRVVAAEKYQGLRQKLQRFFEWRGADDCAYLGR